jgi:hypothetical protein
MTDRGLLEQQIALREEMRERMKSDPWWSWSPHPRQEEFARAMLSGQLSEGWAICANRSGKSDVAAFIGSALARFGRNNPRYGTPGAGEFRPTKGWVVSATAGASRSVIQPKIFDNGLAAAESHPPFIPAREVERWNVNDQILRLKNGSIIEFKTAEAKTISFAGSGLDWVLIDEECPKNIYDELTIRVAGGKRLLIFGACTLLPPEGQIGGVSWMFPVLIKPFLQNPTDCNYKLFGWSIYDNPHILQEELRRLEAKYPVGSPERSIRLDGEWLSGIQGARAYTSFDARLHVRPQGPLNPRRPICWMWDFNVEPMVSLVGQREGKIFRVHRELSIETDASIPAMVQWFHEVVPQHAGEVWIYGDATAKKRNVMVPGGKTEYAVILNLMRTYGCPVRLKVPESNPQVPDRINAVNMQLLDHEGVPNIEIDPSCVELIADLEQVLRDNRGGLKKTHNRHDMYFKRTHSSDAFGYWVTYEEPVRLGGTIEKLKRIIKGPSYGGRRFG